MLYILGYFIKRLPREGFKSLSVPALALALVFLISVLGGVRLQMEEQYEYAMDNTPIYIEVSDGDGSAKDGLMIGERYLSQFTDPDALWSLADHVDEVLLKRSFDILDDKWTPPIGLLIGLSDIDWMVLSNVDASISVREYDARAQLIPESEQTIADNARLEFFEGYDASVFTDRGFVCVVSEDVLSLVDDGNLHFNIVVQRGPVTRSYDFDFTVVGTVSGDMRGVVLCDAKTASNIRTRTNAYDSNKNYYGGVNFDYYFYTNIKFASDSETYGFLRAFGEFQLFYYNYISAYYLKWHSLYAEYIELFDGYDTDIFYTDERVCVVCEDVLEIAQDGVLRFDALQFREVEVSDGDDDGDDDGYDEEEDGYIDQEYEADVFPIDADWKIIGTIKGENAGEGRVYIPIGAAESLDIPLNIWPSGLSSNIDKFDIFLAPDVPVVGSLSCVTSLDRYKAHALGGLAEVKYYEGYDDSIFATDELLCVIGEDMSDRVEDGLIRFDIMSNAFLGSEPFIVELKVAGIITGAEESTVYIPYLAASALGPEAENTPQYTELLHARLVDNRALDEFKETASRTFTRVGIFFNPLVFALTIYDAEFYDMTEAFMQTIFFIDIATPFVYVIAVCVGFVASFLLTRRRTREFAIMRSVGVNKSIIFFSTLFEQALLCAVGVALGAVIFTLTWDYVFVEQPLIFLGCYVLGVIISAAKAAGTDVLRLLKDKE